MYWILHLSGESMGIIDVLEVKIHPSSILHNFT